jgi:hypothetical protein
VEYETTEFVLKLGIPYENGGPVALWVKGAVITIIEGIRPFPKVEAVETMVVLTDDDLLGGGKTPCSDSRRGSISIP